MSVIRNLRKKSGLNQEEFARLFNVHQTAVSQWETGKTSPVVHQQINPVTVGKSHGYGIFCVFHVIKYF